MVQTFLELTGCLLIVCDSIKKFNAEFQNIEDNKKKDFVIISGYKFALEIHNNGILPKLKITPLHLIILSEKSSNNSLKAYEMLPKNIEHKILLEAISKAVAQGKTEKKKEKISIQCSFAVPNNIIRIKSKRFLITDDDALVRRAVSGQLRIAFPNCLIKECTNGKIEIGRASCRERVASSV